MKTPEQIGREVIDAHFGIGTVWEEPNEHGEEGFTRAQAETDIDADDIRGLIEEGIRLSREQIRVALRGPEPIPGVREFPRASVNQLIEAYEHWQGEMDTFVHVWEAYLAGDDFPCPDGPAGIHSTYLADDGSCDYCGDKNR